MTGDEDRNSVREICLSETATLRDALVLLDRTAQGIVLIVDDRGVLSGLATDGDLRRAMLTVGSLESPLSESANRNFISARNDVPALEIKEMMGDRIRHVPVVDDQGRPTSLVSWSDFWRLPVMEPSLVGNELAYVTECVRSNWISSQGKFVDRFQDSFAEYLDVPYAISASSGTAALHLALMALGVEQGDEVLVPDLTFGASANVVLHAGAVPVFCDVDRETWTIDVEDAARRITPKTRAIMPVHLYGHPCDMDAVMDLAKSKDLRVIEDCAESLGAIYKGRKAGTFGDAACFSFFANKVITTGEGGMVVTHDEEIQQRVEILRDHGMSKQRRYWHLYPGYNYRMTNMQAAIGLAQMERIDSFLRYRDSIGDRYDRNLSDLPGITIPPRANWARNIFWLYSILLDESPAGISRDRLAQRLSGQGFETRPLFIPLHNQPAFGNEDRPDSDFPVATELSTMGLSLPTSNDLPLNMVDRVCSEIRSAILGARVAKELIA